MCVCKCMCVFFVYACFGSGGSCTLVGACVPPTPVIGKGLDAKEGEWCKVIFGLRSFARCMHACTHACVSMHEVVCAYGGTFARVAHLGLTPSILTYIHSCINTYYVCAHV